MRYPIRFIFNPVPAVLEPIWSKSTEIILFEANVESDITGGTAAVADVVSEISMVIGVLKISEPSSWTCTEIVEPVGAVFTFAEIEVSSNWNGNLIWALSSPVVKSVVSSEHAITKLVEL